MARQLDPHDVAMGKAVKGVVAQAGLTLAETAPQTTMAPNTLSRRVNGNSSFTWSEIVQIAELTGVSPAEIVASAVRIAERSGKSPVSAVAS